MKKQHVIGVDFGSDSVRAIIVDALSGEEKAESVAFYPRWVAGKYQDANRHMFRQHPLDYLESLTDCVRSAVEKAGENVRNDIAAISVDTTGSTPCPVDENGLPLALRPEFSDDPDAMFHLWKDHTAVLEAGEITRTFEKNSDGIDYTRYQGAYASEWYWAKILHTTRANASVARAAYSWVEHCDWIPGVLTGCVKPEIMYRCACAAGHKAYWHSSWGGLPSEACLAAIDPCLAAVKKTYGVGPRPSTVCLGAISPKWAERLGLPNDTLVGGSSFDAHAGAVGAGVNGNTLVLNLGTSAVDMFAAPSDLFVGKQMSWAGGMAENSIIPGLVGLEAGQAAFGDALAWFRDILLWPVKNILKDCETVPDLENREAIVREMEAALLPALQENAAKIDPEAAPVALDWFNGRRYPYVNEFAQSAVAQLSMGTGAPNVYRGLVTAIALGQKRIIGSWEREGISAGRIVAVGGIAKKSWLLMQTLADALDKSVDVSSTKQACARGAAMYAAVAAGLYQSLEEAQKGMCEAVQETYRPDKEKHEAYERIYEKYLRLSSYMDPRLEKAD